MNWSAVEPRVQAMPLAVIGSNFEDVYNAELADLAAEAASAAILAGEEPEVRVVLAPFPPECRIPAVCASPAAVSGTIDSMPCTLCCYMYTGICAAVVTMPLFRAIGGESSAHARTHAHTRVDTTCAPSPIA